jgi:orotate phosphoribosyltransferase
MHLTPTQDEVVSVLRDTGALRDGHFEYPNGLHSDEYLQVPLALRYYQHERMLSVGLSRLLRANAEIRAVIREMSIVAPATGGLPVAFGVCEALQAKQVYWAEREHEDEPLRLRQFVEPKRGEPVVIVDDILRTGSKLTELKKLLEAYDVNIMGMLLLAFL